MHIQNYNKATLKEILINTPVQLPELPFLHITFLYRINIFYKKKYTNSIMIRLIYFTYVRNSNVL